jgi:hypothetical protein
VAQPLFVTGTARSGTSFFQDLLSQHPDVRLSYEGRVPTEGWICYQRHQKSLATRQGFDKLLDDLIDCDRTEVQNRWIANAIDDHRDRLFEEHQKHGTFGKLVETIYQLPGWVRCWGNKMLRIEMYPDILAHWPDAKFIVLVRDPRAVCASQVRFFPNRRLHYALIYWNVHSKWVTKVREMPEQFLVVRYEDFLAAPHERLQRVLELAGIWDPKIAEEMLTARAVSSEPLGKWRKNLTDKHVELIEGMCHDMMKELGYEPEIAHRQIHISQPRKILEIFLEKRHLSLQPVVWRQKRPIKRLLGMLR